MAVQMLKNKNKPREEIKPVDKERQKVELEKSLESIRGFNQINEEINESHDKQVTKLKQREEDLRVSLRKVEAKYCPDLDKDLDSDKDKDLGSDEDEDLGSDKDKDVDSDKDKVSDLDSDSSDDFVYIQKLKTNKFKCEECNEELTLKNYNRHIQSLKQGLVNGELIKNGSKFDCVICESTLSQYSVDQHLKTKMHLDNVNPRSSFTDGYIRIRIRIYIRIYIR